MRIFIFIILCFTKLVLTQNLVAYFPFNGNANDESGNGNHGVVRGATLTSDRFGNENSAYSFNGTSNYIVVPHSNSLQMINSLSLVAWIYPTGYYGGTYGGNAIIYKSTDNKNGCYGIAFLSNTKKAEFLIRYNLNTLYSILSLTNIELNNWYFLVGVYDGSTMKMYVNGLLENTIPMNNQIPMNSDSLTIGKHNLNSYPYFFKGKIDDIRIYNKALTLSEILSLYNQPNNIENSEIIINKYLLNQNYPNPFNPSTKISYSLPIAGFVTLKIYDLIGNEVSTLVNSEKEAGNYEVTFDASNLSNGVYFYELKVNDFRMVKKLVLMK